ncbi:Holliday junction branch migration protein RuvA [Candidatus Babeliales bacterium]|nr:Holliday junction branch migration protein RuvA [Candidatus Babeliales bacterium]
MIDFLVGNIQEVNEKSVTLDMKGIGVTIGVPQAHKLEKDKDIHLFTYLHWNQEQGPSLFGFLSKLDRKVFLMVIDCPKIGPSIAMSILSQLTANQFLEAVSTNDEKTLSSISGIGAKKAEQIIVQLKHKVQKLLLSHEIAFEEQASFVQWQNVNEVLGSLNYSKPEIAKVMSYLTEKYKSQNCSLDQLIRSALSYLSGNP